MAVVIMPADIVIRTIKIAVVAATMLAVFIVAVRSQEAELLSEAELLGARMSPTAAADAVGNKEHQRIEHDRREVLRCGSHDDLPDGWTTGVADVVPAPTERWSPARHQARPRRASVSRYLGISLARTSAEADAIPDGLITAAFPPEIAAIGGNNVRKKG